VLRCSENGRCRSQGTLLRLENQREVDVAGHDRPQVSGVGRLDRLQ
jgi:hypothetical protein